MVALLTAVCIGLLCTYGMRAGAAWLESRDRRRRPLACGVEKGDVLERLRDLFRETDFDVLFALQDKDHTNLSPAQYRTAVRMAREYKFGLWVREHNLVGGYAVRTPLIIEQFNDAVAATQCPLPVYSVPSADFAQAGLGHIVGETEWCETRQAPSPGAPLCAGKGTKSVHPV